LPEPGFTNLLGELITTTIDAAIALADPMTSHLDTVAAVLTRSRHETILVEAAKLFARNGFAGVSMDDIGATVGIAGPSVYNHFPAKTDVLDDLVRRDFTAQMRNQLWL
jgi:AcrR family transcriptional regulator